MFVPLHLSLIFLLSLWFRVGLFESWVKISGGWLKKACCSIASKVEDEDIGKGRKCGIAHDLPEEKHRNVIYMNRVENPTCLPYTFQHRWLSLSNTQLSDSFRSKRERIKVDSKSIMVKLRFQTNPLQNTSSWFIHII